MFECDICHKHTTPDTMVLSPNEDVICDDCNNLESQKVIEEYEEGH